MAIIIDKRREKRKNNLRLKKKLMKKKAFRLELNFYDENVQ